MLVICLLSCVVCLIGWYGSVNGVMLIGWVFFYDGELSFVWLLWELGYVIGVVGKWYFDLILCECGFDFVLICWVNGFWYDCEFLIDGIKRVMLGFVDDVVVDELIWFIWEKFEVGELFVFWMCI